MKFLIIFALAFATVWAKDLYPRSIQAPGLENEGRIANGQKATIGQFYYLAGVYSNIHGKGYWGGGSLISRNWILTAAHCIADSTITHVYLGALQRSNPQKTYDVKGGDIIPHPYWNPATLKNDIGLLRIPETRETSRIGIIYLPRNNDDRYVKELVVIPGWGQTHQETDTLSNDLRYAVLSVSPASVCEPYKLLYDFEEQICVATPQRISPCFGDAGGPLVLLGQSIQIGVFSYGDSKGCQLRRPVVFTRVSAFLLWINTETKIV